MIGRLRQHLSALSHPLQRLSSVRLHELPSDLFKTINEATGLVRVEELKLKVHEEYIELQRARELVQVKKAAYASALENKTTCQVEINGLLQRKSQWTAMDLARFTSLCQTEHELENAERLAKEELNKADVSLENKQLLYDSILRERYQEEIILGERNKGISNILTWGLLILNTCIFLYSQLITEPRRLKRMENRLASSVDVLWKPIADISNQMSLLKEKVIAIEENVQSSLESVQRAGMEDAEVESRHPLEEPRVVEESAPTSHAIGFDIQLSEENLGLMGLLGVCSMAILVLIGS